MPPHPSSSRLPIDGIRSAFEEALDAHGRVVVSAPTGSGKSTRVPAWLAARGKVLVVEPRRVACRALADRVGELERQTLGPKGVAYVVRRANTMTDAARVVFATPGVVLRWLAEPTRAPKFATIVLDEFHERTLQTDLIAALLLERFDGAIVVMSATVQGDRIAQYIGGPHVRGEGRVHDVSVGYRSTGGDRQLLPSPRDLEQRVGKALDAVWARADGDILVFLPGKGEIRRSAQMVRQRRRDASVIELHGGLTLKEQARVFGKTSQRKVVLATNVAETSLTVPGIGVVIDSGLVRRTRYHGGRGVLTLAPVAMDSAVQRTGRAGRTRAGTCLRLWSEKAVLREVTPPEIARESLVPLVLAAANAGADVARLKFLDPPAEHALETALSELGALGAVERGGLTELGQQLFRLPLEPALGRLLVEGVRAGDATAADVLDLVSGLSVRGQLVGGPLQEEAEDDLRASGDDARVLIRALRAGPKRREVNRVAWEEAKTTRKELAGILGQPGDIPQVGAKLDLPALKQTVMRALPMSVFVKRTRQKKRGDVAWGGPGIEVQLGRVSAVEADDVEAFCALDLHAAGDVHGTPILRVSAALPLTLRDLVRGDVGEEKVAEVVVKKGQITARIERVYGGRVISKREDAPEGEHARRALVTLMLQRRIFGAAVDAAEEGLARWDLARRLSRRAAVREVGPFPGSDEVTPALEAFLAERLDQLGLESADDVALLGDEDIAVAPLPEAVAAVLDRDYPTTVTIGGSRFRLSYNLGKGLVVMEVVSGDARKPPPVSLLPRLRGFKVEWLARGKRRLLRG